MVYVLLAQSASQLANIALTDNIIIKIVVEIYSFAKTENIFCVCLI